MTVPQGFRVARIGPGLAASVCARPLADVGATIARINPDISSCLREHLNHAIASLIVCEDSPAALRQPDSATPVGLRPSCVMP